MTRPEWRSLVDTARSNWVLIAGGVSVVLAALGWVIYGVSPLHTIAEIGEAQKQRRFLETIVSREIRLGNDFLNVGQLPAARAEFEKAQKLDPANADASFGLLKASVFDPVTKGDYDPEVAELRIRAILEDHPDDTHALGYLGDVYRSIDPEEAKTLYSRALAADPGNAVAQCGLGVLYEEQGMRDTALAFYRRASEVSPWNQTYANNLAYQYYIRDEFQKAESLYLRIVQLDGRFLLSYIMFANTQMMNGSVGYARGNLETVKRLFEDTTVTGLVRNFGSEWFFHVQGMNPVHIYTMEQKRAYACGLLAAAQFLDGEESTCRSELETIRRRLERTPRALAAIRTILREDAQRFERLFPAWPGVGRLTNIVATTL